jgi:RecJ-like exonuclease
VSETVPARRGWLGRVARRLTQDAESLDAEVLRKDVAETGARPVVTCGQGEPVTVTGRLRSVVYTPRETVPTVDAELFDGSGSIHLVWLGRRRIPGIEPGRAISARGRVSDRDGTKIIFNPWYELKPAGA